MEATPVNVQVDNYPKIKYHKKTYSPLKLKKSSRKKKSKILIIDDDPINLEIMAELLSMMGYKVTKACNGFEGLDFLAKDKYDLVITDLEMPGINGWDLAVRVKETLPGMPIIMLTGHAKEGVEKKLNSSAVDIAMYKPFKIKDMTEAVNNLLCP